ncbi:MAG: GGDEF domain-containing protein [Alphaproteobacteria bacterium]
MTVSQGLAGRFKFPGPFARGAARLLSALPTRERLGTVVSARWHASNVTAARIAVINERVRAVAAILAFLTVGWIAIDALAFERTLWLLFALGRMAAGAAFAMIALRRSDSASLGASLRSAGALFAVPFLFFVYSTLLFLYFPMTEPPMLLVTAYLHLPFIVMAGLSLFPLTAEENGVLGGGLLALFGTAIAVLDKAVHIAPHAGAISSTVPHGGEVLGILWLLMLMTGVAAIAGMSQLHFLAAFTEESARDALTGFFTRRFGEEILEMEFRSAERSGASLCVCFIDLDRFKSVNDRFGHEAGDVVIHAAARRLAKTLRRQDVAIRWGGEEFLVMMPNTGIDGAMTAIGRLARLGLGRRPDRAPQTASLGLAERVVDKAADWQELVKLADGRMYTAKAAGRNGITGPDGVARPFLAVDLATPADAA